MWPIIGPPFFAAFLAALSWAKAELVKKKATVAVIRAPTVREGLRSKRAMWKPPEGMVEPGAIVPQFPPEIRGREWRRRGPSARRRAGWRRPAARGLPAMPRPWPRP